VKTTRLRDCATTLMSRIFVPAGWISGTRKSNDISQDGVFAENAPLGAKFEDYVENRGRSPTFAVVPKNG
jgi:hypothetical protein